MEMKNYGLKSHPFWGNKGGDKEKARTFLEEVG